MKTLFIPARFTGRVELEQSMIDKLPKKLGLVSTTQFLNNLKDIKAQLEKYGKEVFIGGSKQGNDSQVLGCDISSAEFIDKEVEAFLYIGSGEFHPRGVALKTEKDIFVFNPLTNNFSKLDKAEIDAYKKRKKSAYLKFLSSKEIGILVSTKQGQNNLAKALELKKRLKDKNCYIFIADTLDFSQLENFPFIECWVNTACPRIDEDIGCVNLGEIEGV